MFSLVITGQPKMEELLEAWDKIKLQYTDLIKDHEYRYYISHFNELSRIEITYNQIINAIEELKKYYAKPIADCVNRWLKSSFQFNVNLPDDYDNDLKRAKRRTGGLKIEMDLKRMTLEGLQKRFGERKGMSRESFQSVLIALSDHVKYPITENITVYEYCVRVQRLNQYIETIKLKK
jgi:hypothetical protein